ncbi:MAG: ACT domain-containing protein [Nitriliruptorales bacterium]|nr:ACT domain-containing protein [Nitriliruptorales bacterium]
MPRAYFDPDDGPIVALARRLAGDEEPVAAGSVRELIAAVEDGRADQGLVALEDGRLGTDRETIDALVFETGDVRVVEVHAVEREGQAGLQVAVVAASEPPRQRAGRSLLFCVPRRNRPGTLSALLAPFGTRGVNLTKLESRPLGGRLGEYGFVVEVDAGLAEPALLDALEELVAEDIHVKVLGAYEPPLSQLGRVDDRELPGGVLAHPDDVDRLRGSS